MPAFWQSGCTQYRLVLISCRPGAAHDARPGLLLRRHGPGQERPEHADDELHLPSASSPCCGCSTGSACAFGNDTSARLLRRTSTTSASSGITASTLAPAARLHGIPVFVFAAFQLMFAIITPALISGAHRRPDEVRRLDASSSPSGSPSSTSRSRTGSSRPTAGIGWQAAGVDGLRRRHRGPHQRRCRGLGAGPRRWASGSASAKDPMRPHNVPFVMLGAGLLWFGWFGFNAGSALGRQRPGRRSPS